MRWSFIGIGMLDMEMDCCIDTASGVELAFRLLNKTKLPSTTSTRPKKLAKMEMIFLWLLFKVRGYASSLWALDARVSHNGDVGLRRRWMLHRLGVIIRLHVLREDGVTGDVWLQRHWDRQHVLSLGVATVGVGLRVIIRPNWKMVMLLMLLLLFNPWTNIVVGLVPIRARTRTRRVWRSGLHRFAVADVDAVGSFGSLADAVGSFDSFADAVAIAEVVDSP
ncbi:hypothetical protein WICPIJ_009018 [Wickerhamomyces pijperi]|uniref:Uncharacterized protein n=1 Tax=Wickerhamomyces pijperi TaxID=599730 RepID=A0A9P8TFR7_WICPI|nr:hypothetical protein WICPIJ_009018 [Wickerhamomyces pijperi]